jgi:1-acyl-sn-glycerol-3-phosphate acyltransferase
VNRRSIIQRRLRSVGTVVWLLLVATLLLPVLVLVALAFDLFRLATGHRRFVALRLAVIGWVYLAAEVLGICALGVVWLATGGGRAAGLLTRGTYAIQRWWAGTLFSLIRTLFGLRVEVEGDEVLTPGPIHVFMRHASIIDNLLPSALITAPHGIRLRYVLKRELLSDPALDIAASRLPNYFVDRAAGGASEVAAIGELGMGLGANEGVLIYPEGTRFTPERRERALARLEEREPEMLGRARGLQGVLPPRPGGPLRLLDVEPAADVVIASHVGLDRFSHIRNILDGGLVGGTVRVRFQRFPIESIPDDPESRVSWLYDRWEEVDAWIGSR